MSIPDEALNAALAAFSDEITKVGSMHKDGMSAALEAAAPHLMARAWEEGREDGHAEERSGFENAMNPYERIQP